MNKVVQGVVGLGLLCMSAAPAVAATDVSKLPVVTQELVAPPFVPKHDQVAKGGPKVVKIRMETIEKQVQIAPDGTKIWALTFNGTVPGPLIVVHQDDYVELTLVNPKTSTRSEEHTSELQSRLHLVCRLLLEKKKQPVQTGS